MSVTAPQEALSGTMDVAEFMEFLETRPHEEWWQLIEGVAFMMNPPTMAHQCIAVNFRNLLNDALRVHNPDLRAHMDIGIRIAGLTNFQPRPDVVVAPGIAGYELYAERFQLVAEVLSPSNTRKEVGLKLRRYREAPDNLYAVVIEQREYLVEVHARSRGWQPLKLIDAGDPIELPEVGLRCLLGDLYRDTPLDPLLASKQ